MAIATRTYDRTAAAARKSRLKERTQRFKDMDRETIGLFDEVMEIVFPLNDDGSPDLDEFDEELAEALKTNFTAALTSLRNPTSPATPAAPRGRQAGQRQGGRQQAPTGNTPAGGTPAATPPPGNTPAGGTPAATPPANNGPANGDPAQLGLLRRGSRVLFGSRRTPS